MEGEKGELKREKEIKVAFGIISFLRNEGAF